MAPRAGRSTESPALPPTRLTRAHVPVVVGWLLRSQRMLGADPGTRSLNQFALAGAHLAGSPSLSPSRISRWENGIHPVPHSVLVRYERIVGLPGGTLAAPVELLHRHFATDFRLELPVDRRLPELDKATHARFAEVIDRVHSGQPVTGLEWDEFTAFLTGRPQILLARPYTGTELTRRLLAETLIGDALTWQLRFESFNRMLAHPVLTEDATAACISVADDPHHPAVVEAINLLDGSPRPEAAAFIVTALTNPDGGAVYDGALMAAVRRSRKGAFSPEQCAMLVPALRDLAADEHADLVDRRLGLRILALLRTHPDTRRPTQQAEGSATVQIALPMADDVHEAGVTLVRDLHQHARDDSAAATVGFRDQTLPHLLMAALLDPVPDQRLYVTMLLNASPYRDALAARAAHWMTQPPHPQLRRNLLTLARVLGDARVANAFLTLAADASCELGLRVSALRALGHLRIPAASGAWREAERLAVGTDQERPPARTALGPALAYALGVSGHTAALTRLRDRLPGSQQRSIDWWLNQPPGVRESLARG